MTEPPHDAPAGTRTVESTTDHDTVTHAVARALAAATDQDVLDVAPIGDHLDPDALEALVQSGDETLSVAFDHGDHRVLVDGDGRVEARPRRSVRDHR